MADMKSVKIDGIYDLFTLRFLLTQNVEYVSFDMRPLSFNFLPGHVLVDLLSKMKGSIGDFYLQFADEKDFGIKKIIADARSSLGPFKSFYLDFRGKENQSFCEQFGLPYTVDLPKHSLDEFLSSRLWQGVSLSFTHLQELHGRGDFYLFAGQFANFIREKKRDGAFNVALNLDWDENIFPSLFDLLPIDVLAFSINHKTEQAYRQIDCERIKHYLHGHLAAF